MKEVKVERFGDAVKRGVFLDSDGSYVWMTFSKSGRCKKLETAMKKAGF